jgi:hypothetical protein
MKRALSVKQIVTSLAESLFVLEKATGASPGNNHYSSMSGRQCRSPGNSWGQKQRGRNEVDARL